MDIDNQATQNYVFDLIGNLKKDVAEGIDSIRWTVYGKINRIVKTAANTTIDYGYDPGGNRTTKKVKINDALTTTFYIRDAQGNVMGIYSKNDAASITWDEQDLYGSSRLGMWRWDTIVQAAAPVVGANNFIYDSLQLGSRTYELSNHLGNVLSTISDKKMGHDSSGVVDYFVAEVLSQNDYYPFGMMMPNRKFAASSLYRYGFNGKENDNEVKGEGNQQDYGMRIYDPRLGKFLSVDALTGLFPWYSPYQFAGDNPVENLDLDGGEPQDYRENWEYRTISPLFGGKSVWTQFDQKSDMGWISYEAIYDKVTKQYFFIHQATEGQFYYWKVKAGENQTHYVSDSKNGPNGYWKPFKTKNKIEADRINDDKTLSYIGAGILLIPAVLEYGYVVGDFILAKRLHDQADEPLHTDVPEASENTIESLSPDKYSIDQSRNSHIFRNEEGHFSANTPQNVQAIENTAKTPITFLVVTNMEMAGMQKFVQTDHKYGHK